MSVKRVSPPLMTPPPAQHPRINPTRGSGDEECTVLPPPPVLTSPSPMTNVPVTMKREVRLPSHKGQVFAARWGGAGGSWIASAGADGRALLWQPSKGTTQPVAELKGGHKDEVMRVAWHPSGTRCFTGGGDGTCAVWDLTSIEGRVASPLTRLECSPDEVYSLEVLTSEMMLVGTSDLVQQWDVTTGVRVRALQLRAVVGGITFGGPERNPENKAYVFGLAARGRLAGAVLSDGTVRLIDAEDCKECTALPAHSSPAMGIAFSPTTAEMVTT